MMTHSLVLLDFDQFNPSEQPPEITYQGQQVFLLRRVLGGSIVDLTLAEARALLVENAPEEEL